jgi:subfamily B ATP-binding cassette protein MsbA
LKQEEKIKGTVFEASVFKRIMAFAYRYKGVFIGSLMLALFLAGLAALRPKLLQYTIDNYIINKNQAGLLRFSIYIFIVLLLEVLTQFGFIYLANLLGQNVIRDMRLKVFNHIIHFKKAYFDTTSIGKLVTRVVNDIETISSIFGQGLFVLTSDILKMIAILVLMFFMNVKLSLIVLAVMPIILAATRWFQKHIKATFQDVRNQVANLNGFVQERLSGMKIVQLFNREKTAYIHFEAINQKHKKAHIRTIWFYSIFFPVVEVVTTITIGLIAWYGGLQVIAETLTVGTVIAFISMSKQLFRPLRQIADKFNTLQMGMIASKRVFKILDTNSHIVDNGTLEQVHVQGNITVKDLHFSYIKGEEVLKGISFTVKQGEKIALVGATGAGKSTIINLLNRFYEIDSGSITIDSIPIQAYKLKNLRKHIGVVLQDVFLFADSIYNNIALNNPEISLETVKNAAKAIGIHEFIMTLPNAYQYNIKERGIMLSSGQRQLIAFLRVYVNNPSVLILDEATSSIDTYSEKLIQKATNAITQNRTAIIIAHRLSTIQEADTILVLDKGIIVERGTHDELLKIQGGYYRKLYEMQFIDNK